MSFGQDYGSAIGPASLIGARGRGITPCSWKRFGNRNFAPRQTRTGFLISVQPPEEYGLHLPRARKSGNSPWLETVQPHHLVALENHEFTDNQRTRLAPLERGFRGSFPGKAKVAFCIGTCLPDFATTQWFSGLRIIDETAKFRTTDPVGSHATAQYAQDNEEKRSSCNGHDHPPTESKRGSQSISPKASPQVFMAIGLGNYFCQELSLGL